MPASLRKPEASKAIFARNCVIRFFQTLRPDTAHDPAARLPPVLSRLRVTALAVGLIAGISGASALAEDSSPERGLRAVSAAAIQGILGDRTGMLLDSETAEAAGRSQVGLLAHGPGKTASWGSRDRSIKGTTGIVSVAFIPEGVGFPDLGIGGGGECALLVTGVSSNPGLLRRTGTPPATSIDIATLFCRSQDGGWKLVQMGGWIQVYASLMDAGVPLMTKKPIAAEAIQAEISGPCLEVTEKIEVAGRNETAFGLACCGPA